MRGILVDSNVILDIFLDDPNWADWLESKLEKSSSTKNLFINSVVYSEVSIGLERIEDLESFRVSLKSWWLPDAGHSPGGNVLSRKGFFQVPEEKRC